MDSRFASEKAASSILSIDARISIEERVEFANVEDEIAFYFVVGGSEIDWICE